MTNENNETMDKHSNWIDILETTKSFHDDPQSAADFVRPLLQSCMDQLEEYATEMSRQKGEPSGVNMKRLVLQTRAALRFGMCCTELAMKETGEDVSCSIPVLTTHDWWMPLTRLLHQQRGDAKCRVLAARLLSNLVTTDAETALAVVEHVPLSPSVDVVHANLLQQSIHVEASEHVNDDTASWTDMMLAAAIPSDEHRDALAAVVAALHNCLSHHKIKTDFITAFATKMSSNAMFLNVLLRHFVSARSVTAAAAAAVDDSMNDHWDAATEWIQLLLSRLASLGMFSVMYRSVGSSTDATKVHHDEEVRGTTKKSTAVKVVPEQLVLLYCLAKQVNSYILEYHETSNSDAVNPLGGEDTAVLENYLFLADLATRFGAFWMQVFPDDLQHVQLKQDDTHDPFDLSLIQSGFITVLEIIGSTLGIDNPQTAHLRDKLGSDTELLQQSAKMLGTVTDDVSRKSEGKKTRDVRLSTHEQQLLTNLVTLIGNMCFKNKHNQDLLRNTLVPRPLGDDDHEQDEHATQARNGLHVLLSCTTHATYCFTLREWGVIAIRNALEDNPENQAMVSELDAQNPVQSAALEGSGIKVNLDSKGKVSLSRIDESETDREDDHNSV
jgi:hypothetical protein